MNEKQRTLGGEYSYSGYGLHTGTLAEMRVIPAEPNTGIVFVRDDLEGSPRIPALIEHLSTTERSTTLRCGEASVTMVEHPLSALWTLGVDNAEIHLNGPEIPILTGNALPHTEAILRVGVVEQEAERQFFAPTEPIRWHCEESGAELILMPDEGFSIDVLVDYGTSVLGHQYATFHQGDDYATEIAPCRTFVFFKELETLLGKGLIKGGDLDNAVVVFDERVSDESVARIAGILGKPTEEQPANGMLSREPLKFENELARHKLLDVLGDLALLGRRIKGRVLARKPGHFANASLVKAIRQQMNTVQKGPQPPSYDPNEAPYLDIVGIQGILPHRPPFLLIDRVISCTSTCVVALKNVTMNEPFFVGHFPGAPVMPGVLQIEAMAQCGGILVLSTVPDPENYLTYFLRIDNVRFRQKVLPGDTLLFKLTLSAPIRRGIANMHGEAFVGKTLVTEGDLMAQIVKER